jgi:serine phosphatase RsbU (regulator of sigma subunit)
LVRWDKNPLLISTERDGLLVPRYLAETFDIQEMAMLPLLAQGELLGVMLVDYAGKPHPFSDRMVEMLTGIANQAAMVIQSAHLLQAQQEEAYVSMALLQVAEAVSRSTSLEEAVSTIVRITPILAGVEACVLYLCNQESGTFIPYQQYGLEPEALASFWQSPIRPNEAIVQRLSAGQPFVNVQELGEGPNSAALPSQGSLLALPLQSRGDLLGIMSVDHTGSARRFEERWLRILTGIAGQAALAVENDLLLQEAAEQERMKKELEVAQRIQTSFLPECCPTIPGWELATIWRPAREVGGDFYDFFPLPPDRGQGAREAGRTGLIIADVADKGVPAALFMALSRTLVRTMAMEGRSPSVAIAQANDLILADARSELFVTLFYAILLPSSGDICYVNAGHMPPLVVRAEEGITERLTPHGMAMGVLPGIDYEQHPLHLRPGDTLVLYSDGVIEASDTDKDMYGRDRLMELVTAHRSEPAEELAQIIDQSVADFVGGAEQFDDFTLVVARRTG